MIAKGRIPTVNPGAELAGHPQKMGDHHGPVESSCSAKESMEQGQAGWAEGPSETEEYLSHQGKAPDRPPYARAGALQSRYRQQTAIVRFGEVACEGRMPWKCHRCAHDSHAAEDSASGPIRNDGADSRCSDRMDPVSRDTLRGVPISEPVPFDDALEISEQTEV